LKQIWKAVILFDLLTGLVGCRAQTVARPPTKSSDVGLDASTSSSPAVYSEEQGDASFVFIHDAAKNISRRLTARKSGWETEPVISRDGQLIALSVGDSREGRSEVWVSGADGSHIVRISAADEDAMMPAFGEGDRSILYVKSRFTGHYSPIARPRRHEFDVMKVAIDSSGAIVGASPIEMTQQHFFDLRSLAVSDDGTAFLISTSNYPIGSLIEEFAVAAPLTIEKIFQPHVPSEPTTGPSYGEAAFIGMNIVFTAASESKSGGNFDYNVYRISDVTGANLIQLTHHTGMIDELIVGHQRDIWMHADGRWSPVENPSER
jgi:hypothetical protein